MPIFTTPADAHVETEVAAAIEAATGCTLHHFGYLSPVDFYITRAGHVIGIAELKSRTHATTTYPTVFLCVRKWLSLMMAGCGLNVPAYFIVRFTDGIRWCRVSEIDARRQSLTGRPPRPGATSDIEPMIEVPIAVMKELKGHHS